LTGDYEGDEHLIPRLELSTLDGDLPWILSHRQFPIRPCFAITVNKSQGQSLDVVGVDLQTSAFAHGQLYVVLSRCTDVNRLTISLPEGVDTTLNVAWPEVLDGLWVECFLDFLEGDRRRMGAFFSNKIATVYSPADI
jgi:Helicase